MPTRDEWEALGVNAGPSGHVHAVCNELVEWGLTPAEIAATTGADRYQTHNYLCDLLRALPAETQLAIATLPYDERCAAKARLLETPRAKSPPSGEPEPTTSYADAAITYATELGFAMFPANPKSKRPLIKTGRDHAEYASRDPDVIRAWFTVDYPFAAIACATGAASGIVVIDCDKKHDGERVLAEVLEPKHGALDRRFVVRTQSGGIHIYFAHPGAGRRIKSCVGGDSTPWKDKGVDVRADGGIVLLPPSLNYAWEAFVDGDPFPPLPAAWLEALAAPNRREFEPVDVEVTYAKVDGDLAPYVEILKHHRRRYRAGGRDGDRERGELLDRMIRSQPLAGVGARDSAVTRLGFIVGRLLPGVGPEVACMLALGSLLRIPVTPGEGLEHWQKKFMDSYEKGAHARREQDERDRRLFAAIAASAPKVK